MTLREERKISTSASGDQAIYQQPDRLLQDLIRFDTSNPPGNETECITYINGLLTGAGCECTVLAKAPDRPNLIARLKGQGNAPPLMLYGHVDVQITTNQTWQYPPFEGKIVDGFIWGRGALDMKGGVAMMLASFLKAKAEGLTPAGDVVLALLSDEEGLSNFGAKYLVESHPDMFTEIRYALGEFGGFTFYVDKQRFYPIQVAEKQACLMKVYLRGPGRAWRSTIPWRCNGKAWQFASATGQGTFARTRNASRSTDDTDDGIGLALPRKPGPAPAPESQAD